MKKLFCLIAAVVILACCSCGALASAATTPLTLNTTDLNGAAVDNSLIKDAKLVIVNFWEPWCGPCVNEMPSLQKLYETYADQGLLVVGVYSSSYMKEDAEAVVKDNGITYPILDYSEDMAVYQTGYVPNTILTDGEGKILNDEPLVGARSYENWEALVKEYLK